jgi:hypothetical protein
MYSDFWRHLPGFNGFGRIAACWKPAQKPVSGTLRLDFRTCNLNFRGFFWIFAQSGLQIQRQNRHSLNQNIGFWPKPIEIWPLYDYWPFFIQKLKWVYADKYTTFGTKNSSFLVKKWQKWRKRPLMLPRLATSLARLFTKCRLFAGAKNANFGFLRIRVKTLPTGLFLPFFQQMANEQTPFP